MKSIFDKLHNQELIDRINKLTPNTQAKWGEMNVTQMFAHCIIGLRVAYGEVKVKRSMFGILFGKVAKLVLKKPIPFKRNLPTAKSYKAKGIYEFEKEKAELIEYITKASNNGQVIMTGKVHPLFGKMTISEWDTLQWKHINHHLTQFGV